MAAFAITTLVAIQSYSSKWAVNLANFFTFAKLVGLAVIIGSGLVYLFNGGNENIQVVVGKV